MKLLELKAAAKTPATAAVLNYIGELAELTSTDISRWDIDVLFKGEGSDSLEHSRTEINKIFFAKLKSGELAETKKVEVPAEFLVGVQNLEKAFKTEGKTQIENKIISINQNISIYEEKISSFTAELAKLYDSYYSQRPVLAAEIEKVLSMGMYEPLETDEDYNRITFVTKPVTMKYIRGKEKEELVLPMGSYKVHYYVAKRNITIGAHKDNIICNGHLNPYGNPIDRKGGEENLCFGDRHGEVPNLLAQGRIAEVFGILWTLLTDYRGEGTPHVAFDTYVAQGTINGKFWKDWQAEQIKKDLAKLAAEQAVEAPATVEVSNG